MRQPPDKERARPFGKGGPEVTDATNAVDASTIADPGDGVVVDLAAERHRRLRRDLRLGPIVPPPCSGVCGCWGAPLGGGGAA